ncbi:Aste57867_12391 [Aphanomyces stellatus]|uniref:Microsomal glutathione S-transferase 1 n=1 Tax=Aphanomyces stellatus TaxID=120398 RepID=A0A485KVH2_9STRA|nr:hypothetical protein As57867_012345 [Aphanomyces stellatus]VFT89242.1 Aste57867_12391 [Aphanomyces stellatus]
MAAARFAALTDTQVVMACTVVLYLKYWVCLILGAMSKYPAGSRPPEDGPPGKQSFGLAADDDKVVKAAKVNEMRWNRIVGNDIENIPIGLIMSWACVVCRADPATTKAAVVVFTSARVFHSIFYAIALSRPRGFAYLVQTGCIMTLAWNGLTGAFAASSP